MFVNGFQEMISMKRMMQPIQVMCWNDEQGRITPSSFKPEWSPTDMRAGRVIQRSTSKEAGRLVQVFLCQNEARRFELQYDYAATKWYLTKW